MEIAQPNILKPKTHVLLVGIVLSIINSGLVNFVPDAGSVDQIIILLFAIAFNILTVFWCVYDSRERGEEVGRYFTLSVVIFGVFTLFYYFFKTRGFQSGLIAIGKFIVLFLGVNITSVFIFALLNSIFESGLR